MQRRKRLGGNVAALLVLLAVPGGTGLEPAVIGALVGGVQSTAAVYNRGKLDAMLMVSGPELYAVGERVLREMDLELEVLKNDPAAGRWKLRGRDARKAGAIVEVDQRSPRLSRLRIDVGILGSKSWAKLIYKRIVIQLDQDYASETDND